MTKTKTTMKAIRNNWRKVFCCGYCDLQYIMNGKEPTYYNAGVYGWNCDIYTDFSRDIAITTGYRNMAGKMIPEEIIEKYSKVAKNIMADMRMADYNDIKRAFEENRERFFEELSKI